MRRVCEGSTRAPFFSFFVVSWRPPQGDSWCGPFVISVCMSGTTLRAACAAAVPFFSSPRRCGLVNATSPDRGRASVHVCVASHVERPQRHALLVVVRRRRSRFSLCECFDTVAAANGCAVQ